MINSLYHELLEKKKKISVVGLGYVGLPIALEFAKHFSVIGFDISESRVELMRQGIDPSRELDASAFEGTDIQFSCKAEDLKQAHFHIIAVPTDIDEHKVPNLIPLKKASESVGKALKPGDYVIYESTVYPGCTEEDCLPILEKHSGLTCRVYQNVHNPSLLVEEQQEQVTSHDTFKLGYSPERINPGDKNHTLTKITKIVSGSDREALSEIAKVYGHIIEAGIYPASSIKVGEAAKVIENTQRDINIALMNELSMIFDRMNLDTKEVLEAAGTKWNFLKFSPGLVGGHCIGIDPYYLTYKAQQLDLTPQMILSGRKINDDMAAYIARKLVKQLLQNNKSPKDSKVLIMGITFKENVADIRNSKVVDLVKELMDFSVNVHITDVYASPNEVAHEYRLTLLEHISDNYDAVIVAVAHEEYKTLTMDYFKSIMREKPILYDIKGIYQRTEALHYWRL